jgi:hypothetical protein
MLGPWALETGSHTLHFRPQKKSPLFPLTRSAPSGIDEGAMNGKGKLRPHPANSSHYWRPFIAKPGGVVPFNNSPLFLQVKASQVAVRPGAAGRGLAMRGWARPCEAWPGMAWPGMARQVHHESPWRSNGAELHDVCCRGMARHGTARPGTAGRGKARRGPARPGKASLSRTPLAVKRGTPLT